MFLLSAWAQIAGEKTIQDKNLMGLIIEADPLVQFTLLILIFLSVGTWAIIFYKYKQIKQAQSDAQNFWNMFVRSPTLTDLSHQPEHKKGPLGEIYRTAMESLPQISKINKENQRNIIQQKLTQAREEEIYKLEQYTPFLATTASTAPFIGLFGTVWGILTAFWAIGKAGSTSLATVGPYISEALIATAVGLAAAIPAVIAYNYFVHRIKIIIKMMDLFSDDLALKIEVEM